jgi:hypothetical protein
MTDKVIREPQALYAALENKDALKGGPIFIEKDGKAEAVVLSIERYRELIGEIQSDRWLDQQLARLQPEIDAYETMLPKLLTEHHGEWVAIHAEQIVALNPDRSEVIRIVQEHHYDPVYIHQIQTQLRSIDLPHLERAHA